MEGATSTGFSSHPLKVHSPHVTYSEDCIVARYSYQQVCVSYDDDSKDFVAKPCERKYWLRTSTRIPRIGLMMVGWGGNNGSTVTGGIIANRENIQWETKCGKESPNYYGSMMLSSTMKIGTASDGSEMFLPISRVLPILNPNEIIFGGWDISGLNLADAMKRAKVFEYDLQRQLRPYMSDMVPLPGIYYPDFIAANQSDRADNTLPGRNKQIHLDTIRKNIREFKSTNNLDSVIVLWTANTERFSEIIVDVNDTAVNLLAAIKQSHSEISPSTIYAVAAILEGVPFINGSPQNTLVPGALELAERYRAFVGGDDLKTGQTKLKSVLVDFLVNAGIKPLAITSYNHLGNNDGQNLSAPKQFRSKEISKSTVIDDMVAANRLLYEDGESPDHTVVIKYVPSVGDSKRALDEYYSKIFMNGTNTIAIHNTCEDSLLAAPVIIDLTILTELMTRITYKTAEMTSYEPFHSILSILSYLLKAPVVPQGTPIVNALSRQRAAIENLLRACVGLPPESHLLLEHKAFHSESAEKPVDSATRTPPPVNARSL